MLPVVLLLFFAVSRLPILFAVQTEDSVTPPLQPGNAEENLDHVYGDVIFSSMLFRHGERYRAFQYEGDENAGFYEKKWNLLTKGGKLMMYELGQWARKRYQRILDATPYDADVLSAQSSGVYRCLMSAQLFLAGFYPPKAEHEQWNNALPWQPIPVYSDPMDQDKTLRSTKYCSRYNLEVLRMSQDEKLKRFYDDHKWLFDSYEKHAHMKNEDNDVAIAITQAYRMSDSFNIDARYGYPRPLWAQGISTEVMETVTSTFFQIATYSPMMKRLKSGNLVKRMTDDMVKRRASPALRKRFQVYSAHDSTISAFLNTLDLFNPPRQPPYGSLVLVELREKLSADGSKTHYVTISYKTSRHDPPTLLDMPNCQNPCTLDEFVKATEPFIPDDWENECDKLKPDYNLILF